MNRNKIRWTKQDAVDAIFLLQNSVALTYGDFSRDRVMGMLTNIAKMIAQINEF